MLAVLLYGCLCSLPLGMVVTAQGPQDLNEYPPANRLQVALVEIAGVMAGDPTHPGVHGTIVRVTRRMWGPHADH